MGKLIVGENDLLTWCQNNGEWGQQLINEWVGLDGEGNNIGMTEVSKGNPRKKLLWRCNKNSKHKWLATANDRTHANKNKRTGCPYCKGKKVDESNNLLGWCNNNGEYGRQLKLEWTGLDEDGKQWDICSVHHGKNRLRYLWRCINGHEWYTTIIHRTLSKSGCPYCNTTGTSYVEQLLYHALSELYINCKNRYKAFKSEITRGVEYDIVLLDDNIFIEYSPSYTHQDKRDKDKYKEELCRDRGVRFILIQDTLVYDSYTDIKIEYNNTDELIEKILNLLEHNILDINITEVKDKAFKFSHGNILKEKQLKEIYPNLIGEVHDKLNNIDISKLTVGTHSGVYWCCRNCGHGTNGEWYSRVIDRTGRLSGCPACGYNWFRDKILESKSSVAKEGYNDLYTVYPELAKEWHSLNNLEPTKLKSGSHKQIYWKCIKCGYGKDGEWQNTVHSRTNQKSGCPRCGYNWYKAQEGIPQKLTKSYINRADIKRINF